VLLVPDAPAAELKAVIARCSLFVGARTHATIAAYSSCVPTLVLGYSVKAAGIAEDLFGTDGHYVLPVQQISGDSQITDAFEWLRTNSGGIREKLRAVMPDYLRRAGRNGAEIAGLYRTL
jgi:polysaccharide pyruvyl transferase WcaK-like protein